MLKVLLLRSTRIVGIHRFSVCDQIERQLNVQEVDESLSHCLQFGLGRQISLGSATQKPLQPFRSSALKSNVLKPQNNQNVSHSDNTYGNYVSQLCEPEQNFISSAQGTCEYENFSGSCSSTKNPPSCPHLLEQFLPLQKCSSAPEFFDTSSNSTTPFNQFQRSPMSVNNYVSKPSQQIEPVHWDVCIPSSEPNILDQILVWFKSFGSVIHLPNLPYDSKFPWTQSPCFVPEQAKNTPSCQPPDKTSLSQAMLPPTYPTVLSCPSEVASELSSNHSVKDKIGPPHPCCVSSESCLVPKQQLHPIPSSQFQSPPPLAPRIALGTPPCPPPYPPPCPREPLKCLLQCSPYIVYPPICLPPQPVAQYPQPFAKCPPPCISPRPPPCPPPPPPLCLPPCKPVDMPCPPKPPLCLPKSPRAPPNKSSRKCQNSPPPSPYQFPFPCEILSPTIPLCFCSPKSPPPRPPNSLPKIPKCAPKKPSAMCPPQPPCIKTCPPIKKRPKPCSKPSQSRAKYSLCASNPRRRPPIHHRSPPPCSSCQLKPSMCAPPICLLCTAKSSPALCQPRRPTCLPKRQFSILSSHAHLCPLCSAKNPPSSPIKPPCSLKCRDFSYPPSLPYVIVSSATLCCSCRPNLTSPQESPKSPTSPPEIVPTLVTGKDVARIKVGPQLLFQETVKEDRTHVNVTPSTRIENSRLESIYPCELPITQPISATTPCPKTGLPIDSTTFDHLQTLPTECVKKLNAEKTLESTTLICPKAMVSASCGPPCMDSPCKRKPTPGPIPPNPCRPIFPHGNYSLYKKIFFFICLPIIILQFARVATLPPHGKPECRDYEYMRRITKKYPWACGIKTFFHNSRVNHLKGECPPFKIEKPYKRPCKEEKPVIDCPATIKPTRKKPGVRGCPPKPVKCPEFAKKKIRFPNFKDY